MSRHVRRLAPLCLAGTLLLGCGGPIPSASTTTPSSSAQPSVGSPLQTNSAIPKEFIRRSGAQIVVGADDRPIRLRGVNFGNDIWSSPRKGGLTWVSDMLELLNASGVTYTYHDYHEPSFGLYRNDGGLPDPAQANQPLIDLLTART